VASLHAAFWIMGAAVLAPLLAELPLRFRVPVVVIEVLLGMLIGPHLLGLASFDRFVETTFTLGMAATLFMAGMELEFERIRGAPLWLALRGWAVSVLIAAAAAALLFATPLARAPMMLTLALCTTALGALLPLLRDGRQLDTDFGRLFVAAGTIGEVGPIVAMSLLLSEQYSTWQEFGLLLLFLLLVAITAAVGMGLRPPAVMALLRRTLHASSQLPVRLVLFLLAGYFVLSEQFGFESILGAFAAGMVVGLATRDEASQPLRHKIDAVCFGWFIPFFFIGTGINFNLPALVQSWSTALLLPFFLLVLLLARGAPAWLYGRRLAAADRAPFALYSSVASLSLVVVISDIGVRTQSIDAKVAPALVGAALLSVLIFPTLAGVLRPPPGAAPRP
jgi:Kef-type K+ transport system membrane component KefB